MNPLMLTILFSAVVWQGQAPAAKQSPDEDKKESARRLQVMKDSVAAYAIFPNKDRQTKLTLIPEPQLRWSNPVCSITDGSFFVWTDGDRPEVAIQVFFVDRLWVHEFSSLSSRTPVAELNDQKCWTPSRPGIEFKPVPDTSPAADTTQARLRQMKAIANDFTGSDEFQGTSWWELRLLTTPLIRYGKPDTAVLDGAMFAFVHGTDPEVLLLLEARSSDRGPEWHYALAPMTAYAIKISWKGHTIWSLPWRKSELQKPSDPFFLRLYSREVGATEP